VWTIFLIITLDDLIYINMIDSKDNQDTSFIHRTTEAKPPRSISHYLIGRPLSTADAPHQTIGKAVGLAVSLLMRYRPLLMLRRKYWEY